jgi:hypothetical protein
LGRQSVGILLSGGLSEEIHHDKCPMRQTRFSWEKYAQLLIAYRHVTSPHHFLPGQICQGIIVSVFDPQAWWLRAAMASPIPSRSSRASDADVASQPAAMSGDEKIQQDATPAGSSRKQPPPEKPFDIRRRSLVILSFWLIVVCLGLPIWWMTTSIYRASLPLSSMMEWADGKVGASRDKFGVSELTLSSRHADQSSHCAYRSKQMDYKNRKHRNSCDSRNMLSTT